MSYPSCSKYDWQGYTSGVHRNLFAIAASNIGKHNDFLMNTIPRVSPTLGFAKGVSILPLEVNTWSRFNKTINMNDVLFFKS